MKKPNILLITADQLCREALGCYGATALATPNIDGVAERGVRHTNCHTPSPLCLPSRCSLATGLYPHATRSFSNNLGRALDPELPNIYSRLKAEGYQTVHVGKCHYAPVHYAANRPELTQDLTAVRSFYRGLGIDELVLQDDKCNSAWYYDDFAVDLEKAGFLKTYRKAIWETSRNSGSVYDYPLPSEWHPDAWVGRKASEEIRRRMNDDTPTFMWISFSGPHYPIDCPKEYLERVDISVDQPRRENELEWTDATKFHTHHSFHGGYGADGCKFAENGACENYDQAYWTRFRQGYYGNVALIDEQVGRVFSAAGREWLDEALVIFTADHGDLMGHRGLWGKQKVHYDEVLKVPFLIKFPDGGVQGARDSTPKANVEERGAKVSDALISLIDVLPTCLKAAGAIPPNMDGLAIDELERAVGRDHVLSEADGFIAYADARFKHCRFSLECKPYQNSLTSFEELYDLGNDPREIVNLAHDGRFSTTFREIVDFINERHGKRNITEILNPLGASMAVWGPNGDKTNDGRK